MNSAVEALYIFDELNTPILEHVYRGRPPAATVLLALFRAHPTPRPSLLYLSNASPPISVFSVTHSNLLFLVPSNSESEPLIVLEFLHRLIDVLEEFVGAPLLAAKIQSNYDVVAQLLNEMCDGGIICNTEPNALQEIVEIPGWMDKLLVGVGLPGASPILGPSNSLKSSLTTPSHVNGASAPAIPWRRRGVRHTSNELYVDIVESLSVTMAPSGRPISALVHGTIVFTAKVSGVPDLLLSLAAPGGQKNLAHKFQLPVFHPCVRLARWRENPGELSFIPPDGRFVLAGYEVDLQPVEPDADKPPNHMEKLFLPATVDLQRSLGPTGAEFEVRLTLNTNFPGLPPRSGLPGHGSGTSTPSFLGAGSSSSSNAPTIEEVVVTVPISSSVRNLADLRASRGEANFTPGSSMLKWRVPTTSKDAGSVSGTATLRCTITGPLSSLADEEDDNGHQSPTTTRNQYRSNPLIGYYDDTLTHQPESSSYQQLEQPRTTSMAMASSGLQGSTSTATIPLERSRKSQMAYLMPSSVSVSFTVRGWLPSGIRVDGLMVDTRRSRGLGEGVKPYKGVKYLCVSRQGVEKRC
ncbi:adaptin [Histoplasma ohiense]|nr:adaptin [Histoplasma ohiense (nom. inval.)]